MQSVMVRLVVFVAAVLCLAGSDLLAEEPNPQGSLQIATFDIDATPPIGVHMAYDVVRRVDEMTLRARGIVIIGSGEPIVLCAVDWIGIANEAHDAFRDALAAAAGTTRERVAVHTLHQHDAPGADFTAQRLLSELGVESYPRFDSGFPKAVIGRLQEAVRTAVANPRKITHVGFGSTSVPQIASNRRILGEDGKVRATRYTATKDAAIRAEPEGTIDPELSLVSFWDGDNPVAALTYYACHPQSYYRTGVPSPDFPGIARFIAGQARPNTLHVHFNGAGGNIGAGKYNDGSPANRLGLADRLADAITAAWDATQRRPVGAGEIHWSTEAVQLPPAQHLNRQELEKRIRDEAPRGYISQADQLAWLDRVEAGKSIDIACLAMGDIRILHMPGELFVEYQLAAKRLRPDLHVCMAAYGDYGPGYIGTAVAYEQGGYETSEGASNVSPRAEAILLDAIEQLLGVSEFEQESAATEPVHKDTGMLDSFEIHPDFEVQVVAHEPNVVEPILIAFDEHESIYAAEFLKFPAFRGQSDGPDGRVRLLKDLDSDGYYEHATIFADNLAWPTGIAASRGGIFVVSAPDLWYLRDVDGDGRADEREKWFTGFGFTTEEGTANSLIYAHDGWIYGAGSQAGGTITSLKRPDDPVVELHRNDFRFHPDSGEIQALSGSEQFGLCFDDWGNRFLCQNSKPAVQVVLPKRYVDRNPHVEPPAVLQQLNQDTAVFRLSAPEPWRLTRTDQRLQERPGATGPSIAHDVFTACSGLTIYRGDAYPTAYRGQLFVGDVQSNLVHRRSLERNGIAFGSHRIDDGTEFLRSSDNSFRPTSIINAPDGTLYVVDMHRAMIETPDSIPDDLLKEVDYADGREQGRIFRIAPKGFKPSVRPKLATLDDAELLAEIRGANGWRRDTAARLLRERGLEPIADELRRLSLRRGPSLPSRLQFANLFASTTQFSQDNVDEFLLWAESPIGPELIRLTEPMLDTASDSAVAALRVVVHPQARYQAVLSLGSNESDAAAQTLAALIRQDAENPWMQSAVLSARPAVLKNLTLELLELQTPQERRKLSSFLRRALYVCGRAATAEDIARFAVVITDSPGWNDDLFLRSIILPYEEGLRAGRYSLLKDLPNDDRLRLTLEKKVITVTRRLGRADPNYAATADELEVSRLSNVQTQHDILSKILGSGSSTAVKRQAIESLGDAGSSPFAEAVMGNWDVLDKPLKGVAIDRLLSTDMGIGVVLERLTAGSLSADELSLPQRNRIVASAAFAQSTAAVQSQLIQPDADRAAVIERYAIAAASGGDEQLGHAVFRQHCAACHRLGGEGTAVGPDLAMVQTKTATQLLLDILEPDASVAANFQMVKILTVDDEIITGIIEHRAQESLTVRTATEVMNLRRQDIAEIEQTPRSLMPTGFEQVITPEAMSGLISFLTRPPADAPPVK